MTRSLPSIRRRACEHPDIRIDRSEGRPSAPIACFKCGRLFGHLHEDEVFVAFNPQETFPSKELDR